MPKHRKQIKRLCTLDTYTSQNVEPSLKVTLCGERNSHVVLARGRMPARQASAPAARQREVRGAGRGRADMLKTVRCAGAPWTCPRIQAKTLSLPSRSLFAESETVMLYLRVDACLLGKHRPLPRGKGKFVGRDVAARTCSKPSVAPVPHGTCPSRPTRPGLPRSTLLVSLGPPPQPRPHRGLPCRRNAEEWARKEVKTAA